jgi:predicted nuclease of predicted toxin-antitoxin system
MRFLADENVSRLVVERLRTAGFDVVSVRETRPGAPDKDILDAADSDDRVLARRIAILASWSFANG